MTIYTTLNKSTEQTRRALHEAYARARAAGDRTEMARLEALAVELDTLRRKLALEALAEAVAAVDEIRAALHARTSDTDTQPRDGRGADDAAAAEDATSDASATEEPDAGGPEDTEAGGPEDGASDPEASDPEASDPEAPAGEIAWGAVTRRKHGEAFNEKVRAIAAGLGCDPSYLMAAMAFETAETFSPAIRNAAGSGATGLIQFMPSTARRLGTTTARLAQMSALRQLDYVEAYFRTATRRRLRTLSDIYMAILWPVAVGKAESHVLFRKPSRAYAQNHGFDVNRDGLITKAEAAAKVQQKLVKGMKDGRIG